MTWLSDWNSFNISNPIVNVSKLFENFDFLFFLCNLSILIWKFFSHDFIILLHQIVFVGNFKVSFFNLITEENLFLDRLTTVHLFRKVRCPKLDTLWNLSIIPQLKDVGFIVINVKGVAEINVIIYKLMNRCREKRFSVVFFGCRFAQFIRLKE